VEVGDVWRLRISEDPEFSDIAAEPAHLILAVAEAVRVPQGPGGADQSWRRVIEELALEPPTIGVFACKLRHLVGAIEEIVLPALAVGQQSEALARLHWVAYLGLEVAARAVASQLSSLAYYSSVTGLRNRRAFERDAQQIVASRRPCRITYIDMDGLKRLNDTEGHQAGDAALRGLGERLSLAVRGEGDTPYHLSGDEFCVTTVAEPTEEYVVELVAQVASQPGAAFSHGSAVWPDEEASWSRAVDLADHRMREHKQKRKAGRAD